MSESDKTAAHRGPTYLAIYLYLVGLTVLTVGVSYIPWNPSLGVVVAMAIAALKATLVGLYFMHLRFEVPSVYIVIGVPGTLTVILVLALMPDVVGRFL